jgi:hypothetical protein
METRTKPGAMAGFCCLIPVKKTQVAANPTGSGYITAQIFVFRDNPLKHTDPDGRIDNYYLNKGSLKMLEGRIQLAIGLDLRDAGYATILINVSAPAIIEKAEKMMAEGQEKAAIGTAIIFRTHQADSIGKGHSYSDHGKWDFNNLGITGDDSPEDKERYVSIINGVIENPTMAKSLKTVEKHILMRIME